MKLNLSMTFALLITLVAFSPVHGQQRFPGTHVVLVVVKDVHKFECRDPKEQTDYDKLDPPLYEATLQVQEVLSGAEKLKGEECFALCRDEFLDGNSPVIIPALKVGEVAIFLVGGSDGKIHIASVCGIEGGEMPYILGRNPDFAVILERLRARRDHPETNKATEVKAGPATAPPPPPAIIPQPKPAPPAAPKPAIPKRAEESHLGLWMTGTAATLTACYFLLRKRRQ